MSDHNETRDGMNTTDRIDLDAIRARADSAHAEVVRQCAGGRWLMSVPARPGYDSDLIISETVKDVEVLAGEVERLREERDAYRTSVAGLRASLGFKQGIIDDLAATVERMEAGA